MKVDRTGDREAKTGRVTIAGQIRKVIKKMLGRGNSKGPRAEELEIAQGQARVQCLKTVREGEGCYWRRCVWPPSLRKVLQVYLP